MWNGNFLKSTTIAISIMQCTQTKYIHHVMHTIPHNLGNLSKFSPMLPRACHATASRVNLATGIQSKMTIVRGSRVTSHVKKRVDCVYHKLVKVLSHAVIYAHKYSTHAVSIYQASSFLRRPGDEARCGQILTIFNGSTSHQENPLLCYGI